MVVAHRPDRRGVTLEHVSGATTIPTSILVLRHGESEWNSVGRWQGTEDPALSERGVRQARAAGLRLGSFDAIWASTLQRAAHTAEIIAEHLGIGPVELDTRLIEIGYGPWQGLTRTEIEAGWPGFLSESRRPDGAEPFDTVVGRMTSVLRDIAASAPGGEVLVVAHGGVLRAVRRFLSVGGSDDHFPNLSGARFVVHVDRAHPQQSRIVAGEFVEVIDESTALDVL
jgi:broad specificity phosphatase PhoE